MTTCVKHLPGTIGRWAKAGALLLALLPALAFGQTIFNYTGGTQSYTVPSGVTSIKVKAWGAGGGGGFAGSQGGGGGYAEGLLAVTPGQVVTVNVGGGGRYSSQSPSTWRDWPSAGAGVSAYNGGGDTWVVGSGGQGGGYTEVTLGSAVLIAGGGGGASDGNTGNGQLHGGGGGGGTATGPTPGGYANQGGRNGAAGAIATGGGGGGGWNGGGGGGSGGGGGGGSSNASGFTNTTYSAGGISTAGNSGDAQRGGAGAGGGGGGNGAHGRVVIIPNVPPVITSTLTASGTVGQAISTYTIAASNNPTSFNATGLPAGLSVNTATGAITGTPTSAGTSNSTITATNSAGTDSETLVWTIVSPIPVITSPLTQGGTMGASLTYQITATNNPTSYTATSLPAGLSLNPATGAITGAPSVTGNFNSTIGASNSYGASATKTLAWTIVMPKPVITSSTGPVATLGQHTGYVITATNSPTLFAATNIPPGLSLNETTGAISGTPTVAGVYMMQVTATNSGGTSDPVTVQWTITAPTVVVTPANTGTAVINGNVGVGSSSPQARLHVVGNVNNEVARFQGRTDSANVRNYMSLYSSNPDYWWEFSVQDELGDGNHAGFALRTKYQDQSISQPRLFVSPPANDVGPSTPRSFMRLYSHNPSYAWEFALQGADGNASQNGFALRELNANTLSSPRLFIQSGSAKVGINTVTPSHELTVNGTIRAKEVIVDTGWADYVFADDYELAPLAEVEAHIREHRHLPGIPSAAQVEQGGVSLGEMQSRLLAKIEELTLHQIALEKRLLQLEAENASFRAEHLK